MANDSPVDRVLSYAYLGNCPSRALNDAAKEEVRALRATVEAADAFTGFYKAHGMPCDEPCHHQSCALMKAYDHVRREVE